MASNVTFSRLVLSSSPRRLAFPIAVYPGRTLAGVTVRQMVCDPLAQFEAVEALRARLNLPCAVTAMDLSAEAEAFGCAVRMTEDDVPTVIGRRATSPADIAALPIPQPGDARTAVPLEVARRLAALPGQVVVLGGMIGPFSLAARLFGVSDIMELVTDDPDALRALLEKTTAFLAAYALAFKQAGANGVVMAEPAAGLLSPRALASYSSSYVQRILAAVESGDFEVVLHNCAARLMHLPAVLQSGARVLHFGAPMDLPAALAQVPHNTILCGNLDPAAVFVAGAPGEVAARTRALLAETAPYRNFAPSSGCDLPPDTPLANLAAFCEAING